MSHAGICNCELASPWINRLDSIEVHDDDWITPRWSSAPVPTWRMLVRCTTWLRFLLAGLSNISCGYRPFSLYFSLSSLKTMLTLLRRCGVKIIVTWDTDWEFSDRPLVSVCLTVEVESQSMSSAYCALRVAIKSVKLKLTPAIIWPSTASAQNLLNTGPSSLKKLTHVTKQWQLWPRQAICKCTSSAIPQFHINCR